METSNLAKSTLLKEIEENGRSVTRSIFETVMSNGGSAPDVLFHLQFVIASVLLVLEADPSEAMPILSQEVIKLHAMGKSKMRSGAN